MADPFSISGGVVGVVSLGLTVCQGLLKYYTPWKSYDDEISGFTTRLEGLNDLLQVVHGLLSADQERDLPSQYKGAVSVQLKLFEDGCQKLGEMLEECKSTDTTPFVRKHSWLRLRRASYPFKKETLVTLSQYVSGLQHNLGLSFSVLICALLTHQQTQIQGLTSTTTATNLQTTRILTVVEQSHSTSHLSQSMSYQRNTGAVSSMRRMLEPETLNNISHQTLTYSLSPTHSLEASSSRTIEGCCTCNIRARYSPTSSFSESAFHGANCPHDPGTQQTTRTTTRYTLFNRLFFRMSVSFIMTVTTNSIGRSFSPALQLHRVVPDDSPAFRLLEGMGLCDEDGQEPLKVLESTQKSILQMVGDHIAGPADQLADGTTLLHKLLFVTPYLEDVRFLYALRDFISALFNVGVPVALKTLKGDSVADILLRKLQKLPRLSNGIMNPISELLQMLFKFGSDLGSLTSVSHHEEHKHLHRRTAILQRVYTDNGLGSIPLSRLEMAIVKKSKAGLRECLPRTETYWFNLEWYTPEFGKLLACCLGWAPGMLLVLESPLPRDTNSVAACFEVACEARQIKSALLLLRYRPVITLDGLKAAVSSGSTAVLKSTVSILAAQRRELLDVALRHLPHERIRKQGLSTGGLLDCSALSVYGELVERGIDPLLCGDKDGITVYSAIGADLAAAELLYEAGFTDLNQRGEGGDTPIVVIGRYCVSLVSFAAMADWMICRGADLYIPSRHGHPAIFDVASELGTLLHMSHYDDCSIHGHDHCTSSCELKTILSTHVGGVDLISTVLADNTRDDCFCACSQGGCSPLSQFLRSYYPPSRLARTTDWTYPEVVGQLQDLMCKSSKVSFWKTAVSAIIRYLTFEALGMTHTCHCSSSSDKISIIPQLDDLMLEFDRKYDELGVGIREFIEGYWHTCMDEVLQERDIDPDEAMNVREIGVVLSDADDSASDDGED